MTELKKRNDGSVRVFLDTIADLQKRQDSLALIEIMSDVTMCEPEMWGASNYWFWSLLVQIQEEQPF